MSPGAVRRTAADVPALLPVEGNKIDLAALRTRLTAGWAQVSKR